MALKEEIEKNIKKKRQILFSNSCEYLTELKDLFSKANHKVIVLWSLDCAKITLSKFEEKNKQELRPRKALELCYEWAQKMIKMNVAKKSILECHQVAKEMKEDKVSIALCHAIGQAGASVHVKTHAMGFVYYELTSIVFENSSNDWENLIFKKINYYKEKLFFWEKNMSTVKVQFADFLNK